MKTVLRCARSRWQNIETYLREADGVCEFDSAAFVAVVRIFLGFVNIVCYS